MGVATHCLDSGMTHFCCIESIYLFITPGEGSVLWLAPSSFAVGILMLQNAAFVILIVQTAEGIMLM